MTKRHDLPSTYYRVSLKALIFDSQKRLLVFQGDTGKWEIPGGGLEHNEAAEECLRREIAEEVGGEVRSVDGPRFIYTDYEPPGYYKLSVAFRVELSDKEIAPDGDGLIAYRYVDREEFLSLPFHPGEQRILDHVDQIWDQAKLSAAL